MTISFARENFADVQPEYGRFVDGYWNNSPANDGHIPLDFNWDAYRALDEMGSLHLTVGREDYQMIAAALYMVFPDLKRKTRIVAHCDTFAVSLDYRGMGLGKALYAEAEARLITDCRVNSIVNMYREVYGTTPIFESLGFRFIERVYEKMVG